MTPAVVHEKNTHAMTLVDPDTLQMYLLFLMFRAWFYILSCVLSTLWSTFHMISWTNLLTRATVPAAYFLLFLVSRSQKMNILVIGWDKSQSHYFTEGHLEPEYETEKG